MSSDEEVPVKPFSHYIGEGVHYVKKDVKGAFSSLLGRRKHAHKEASASSYSAESTTPEKMMEYIESMEQNMREMKEESAWMEEEIHRLKRMVREMLRNAPGTNQRSRSKLY